MTLGWSALVAAVAAVLVVAFMVWWRWRTLVRTPGTFTARVRGADAAGDEPGSRVIGRYDEVGLDLMTVWSVDPRPAWKGARHRLRLQRQGPGRQQGSVVVRVDGGPSPIVLDLDEDECSGLSAWVEAGPAVGFGTWRELPTRRPRSGRHARSPRRRND